MQILTVLCSGGSWTPDDVKHLHYWVCRYARRYFSFVCLTDLTQKQFPWDHGPTALFTPSNVRIVPLITDMRGWWAKMEVFRTDLPSSPVRWYMDLDVTPIKPIGVMYESVEDTEFLVLRDLDGTPFSTRMMKWTTNIDTHSIFTSAWRYWVEHRLDEKSWPEDKDKVFVEQALLDKHIDYKYLDDVYPDAFTMYVENQAKDDFMDTASWVLFRKGNRPKEVSTQWYLEHTRKPGPYNVESNFGRGSAISPGIG